MSDIKKTTMVVGDLHGDYYKASKALEFPGKVIFVGDFLDSYEYSVDDQIKTLVAVLEACEKNPSKVQSCLGNHECSYLEPGMQCSGFNHQTRAHVIHLKERMLKTLKRYIWHKGWLISHAGVSNELLRSHNISLRDYLNRQQFNDIGSTRGGWAVVGGLHWCDWWAEFVPVPGVNQIVGHSSSRPYGYDGIVEKIGEESLNYNVDCLVTMDEVLILNEAGKAHIDTL